MVIFLILAGLAALPASAQTPPRRKAPAASKPVATAPAKENAARPESWPLTSLKVTGNKIYSEQQIIAASGLKIGQNASNADFDAARARLEQTGAFESIGLRFGPAEDNKGFSGVLEVVEVSQLYPFRFEELPATDAELRTYLKSKEPLLGAEIPGSKEMLERLAAELQEFVTPKGWKDKVTGKLVADKPGELAIVFRSSKPPKTIAEVQFVGNQVVAKSLLHNRFFEVAVGAAYSETRARELLESAIRPVYEARGRLRATFPKIEAKETTDIDGVSVTVTVVEGGSYNFGEIRSAGSVIPQKEVLQIANLKSGDLANFDVVQEAVGRIQKRYRAAGYMKSETTVDRQIRDKELVVDLTIKTVPGDRYTMGKLTIEGLDVTTEPAMRKLWTMTPGKPYNGDYPQLFIDRVKEEGYLDNLRGITFSPSVDESAKTVDVTLNFKGGPDPEQKKKRPF